MNDVTHFNSAHRRAIAEQAAEGLGGSRPPHVSIEGGGFTLIDNGGNSYPWPHKYLDVIIIDANSVVSKRMFPPGPYNPNNPLPPVCWSDNGIAPSRSVPINQRQAQNCAACPHNEWGSKVSDISGKNVKRCGDLKKFAVLIPDDADVDFPYELDAPPNSLKAFREYANKISAFNNPGGQPADLMDVVTRVSFAPKPSGTLLFTEVRWVNGEEMTWVETTWATNVTDLLVGRNDQPADPNEWRGLPQPEAAAGALPHSGPAQGNTAPASAASPLGAPARAAPQAEGRQMTAPAQAQEPKRGRGRPAGSTNRTRRGSTAPANGPAPAPAATPVQEVLPPEQNTNGPAPDMPAMPGFLQRHQAANGGGAPPPAGLDPQQARTRGGFSQAPQADGDVNSALDTAFNMAPPRGRGN